MCTYIYHIYYSLAVRCERKLCFSVTDMTNKCDGYPVVGFIFENVQLLIGGRMTARVNVGRIGCHISKRKRRISFRHKN